MKDKIFAALKQEYSQLGLGDEILMAHAESLANIGLVTEQNLSSVVSGQKSFLEGLQKANDKRAADAAKTARENAQKEFAEAQKKAEEEAKLKAEEEAKKKADEEAKKAELEKAIKEGKDKDIAEMKQFMEEMRKAQEKQQADFTKTLNELKAESERKEKEFAAKERDNYILNKAREMGIPQTRIDEGFVIAADADNAAIDAYLGKVASNAKASQLPGNTHQQKVEASDVSKEEMDKIVAGMV